MTVTLHSSVNRLLASLSSADVSLLEPSLNIVSLPPQLVLYEPGDEITHIYFPHNGMISLLAVMGDGQAVESATIGNEGVVGAMAGLGLHHMLTRAVVQLTMIASQIAAPSLRRAVAESATLRDMIVRYNEALLCQVQMTAACNALHPINARLARWILQTRDRVEDDIIPLTQELLSEMLGVRRSSVSEVAGRLRAAGLIRYTRGLIEILDRKRLEAVSCECYETMKKPGQAVFRS